MGGGLVSGPFPVECKHPDCSGARSFTGAAVKLGTSSGQASKLVSRLEAELGVRLLNRTTRAVSETEAGRAYFERVRSILDEIDDLDLAIRNVAQTPRGRLRLTAPVDLRDR